MKLPSAFLTLFLATCVVAHPSGHGKHFKTCSTSHAKLVLPTGQTDLAPPTGDPSFVLLGVGYQNYTCATTGKYVSAGALASLFDLSCLSLKDNGKFETIQDDAYEFWSKVDDAKLKHFSIRHESFKLGDHFFQPNGNGGISPVWDFRGASTPDKPNAFVVAAKVAGLAAPTGPQDVDWLQLKGVTGDLASAIYRTHTKGGQPPASCNPGSDGIRVKYVSKYWLYGGSITL